MNKANTAGEAIETASVDELQGLQLERMRKSLQHAYDNVPFYKQSFDDKVFTHRICVNYPVLAKFPLPPKKDLRDNYPFGISPPQWMTLFVFTRQAERRANQRWLAIRAKTLILGPPWFARSIRAAGGSKRHSPCGLWLWSLHWRSGCSLWR